MNLMELLHTRRTFRRFTQTEIPQTVVNDIIDALRYSSSGTNRQRVRLIIAQKPADVAHINSLVKWAGALPPELGTPKEGERPTLFVAVVQNVVDSTELNTDTGIALANMTLAAWAHGVGHCIMGAINRPVLSEFFQLSEQEHLHSVIAFGYPSHQSTVVDMPTDGSLKYYLDDARDYYVPKHSKETLAKFI